MGKQWTAVNFGEVVTLAQGLCFNAKTNHLMAEEGLPLLRIADLINNTKTKFVDAERVPKKYISSPQDIIYSRTGQVGLVFKGRVGVVHNNCFRVIPQQGVEADYVYWYLRQPSVIEKARSLAGGAAQPDLGHDAFKSISFSYPAPEIQRRIAGILSAYDELIENSQRRMKILEGAARALYREWFVHFRFPGSRSVPCIPSTLGAIPEGWMVKTVADAFEISGGGTPSRKEPAYWEGGKIQWFSPSDLTSAGTMFMDDSSDHITTRGLTESSARLFPALSVMLTSRATIGAIAINTQEACTNQGFITCMPNDRVPTYFLYNWLAENVPMFQRMASGATFKEISRGVFKTVEFLQPPAALVMRFEAIAATMAEQCLVLQRQIANLRRTRDLLLPRLLSGQINVEAG